MSLAYDQKPPDYSDPSAADDISSLLNTALAVQESFSKINQGLKRIDDINETHLLPRLIEADEVRHHKSPRSAYAQIAVLRSISSSSTNRVAQLTVCTLLSKVNFLHLRPWERLMYISEFINVVLPIALDTQHSINDRVEVIKESASKVNSVLSSWKYDTDASQIARSAQEDLRPYDQRVDALKSELHDIHGSLVEILDREKKNKEQLLAELSQQRSNLPVDKRLV